MEWEAVSYEVQSREVGCLQGTKEVTMRWFLWSTIRAAWFSIMFGSLVVALPAIALALTRFEP